MAEQEGKSEAPAAEKEGGAMKGILKWLAIGVGFFAIATVSPLVSQKLFGVPGAASAEHGDADAEEQEPKGPPQYVAIDPSIIASVADGHAMRFLQVDVQLMTRDPDAAIAIETHEPVLRNNLLMLFGAQEIESLKTLEGREALRARALAEVRNVLADEVGNKAVEDLYFTGFVIQ